MKKMWEGRFHKETNKLLEKFNASITFDKRMYEEDITGSIAHSRMLAKQGIIAEGEQKEIENGLLQIKDEIKNGKFEFKIEDEDIHMSIENCILPEAVMTKWLLMYVCMCEKKHEKFQNCL